MWINQKSGGMAKSESYDSEGKIIRKFQILDIQPTKDGTWLPESMSILSRDPKSGKLKKSTIELEKPKKR